jgi:hypothetical protein
MICGSAILNRLRCIRALDEITNRIETKQSQNCFVRFIRFMEHPDMIAELSKKLNVALDLFKVLRDSFVLCRPGAEARIQFGAVMRTEITADKTLRVVQNNTLSRE